MGQSTPIRKAAMTKATTRCPICKAETEHAFRPFCSNRCADIDLGKWLTGSYTIPVDDNAGDSEDDGSAAAASRTPSAARRPTET
jgi:uncharacterized protein